jgi:hypothetical protein
MSKVGQTWSTEGGVPRKKYQLGFDGKVSWKPAEILMTQIDFPVISSGLFLHSDEAECVWRDIDTIAVQTSIVILNVYNV